MNSLFKRGSIGGSAKLAAGGPRRGSAGRGKGGMVKDMAKQLLESAETFIEEKLTSDKAQDQDHSKVWFRRINNVETCASFYVI